MTLFLTFSAVASAQLSKEDSKLLDDIVAASASMKSFNSDFRQVQEVPSLAQPVIQTGRMEYFNDGRVIWKYETPKLLQLSMLKDKVVTTSQDGAKVTLYSESPYLEQMRDLIVGMVSGKQFTAQDQYEISLSKTASETTVSMIPKARRMKKLFSSMGFTFGKDLTIVKVVLNDPQGGKTTITFSNKKIGR